MSNPANGMVPDSTGEAGVCARAATEKKLGLVKWTEAADEWTATLWVHRVEQKPPKDLPYIGFRCVRPVSKNDG